MLALTNVTGEVVEVECPMADLGLDDTHWYDLVAGEHWNGSETTLRLELGPYDVVWLVPLANACRTGAREGDLRVGGRPPRATGVAGMGRRTLVPGHRAGTVEVHLEGTASSAARGVWEADRGANEGRHHGRRGA